MNEAVAAGAGRSSGLSAAGAARLIALLLPLALLGGAFGSQYLGGLHPCEMCYWQRWPHGAAILLAALGFAAPAESARSRMLILLAALAIAVSGAIGVYHAGVEAKVFEGFTQCTATGKGLSTADLLKQITHAPIVRCDEVQFRFLGISMAGWNAILSLSGAALILILSVKGSAHDRLAPRGPAARPGVDVARRPGRRIWRDTHLCRAARRSSPELSRKPSSFHAWRRRSKGISIASID